MPPRIIIVGMGNPVLSDDAIGIRLVRDFVANLVPPVPVDFHPECTLGGLNLIEVLEGYDRAILIDSIKTRDGVPGNWYSFTAASLEPTLHLSSIHDVNFATAMELGRRLGTRLPPPEAIQVIAVEIDDNLTLSEKMTPAMEDSFPALAGEIKDEVERMLAAWTPAR